MADIEEPASEGLTELLSRLPMELRSRIYVICLPCIRHRKQRMVLDYIKDSQWVATSPALFREAGSLVFSEPVLHVYTKLEPRESFTGQFDNTLTQIYGNDAVWAIDLARTMITRLAVTIRYPAFFHQTSDVHDRLPHYFSQLSTFTALEELHISFSPEYIPSHWAIFDRFVASGRILTSTEAEAIIIDSPISCKLGNAICKLKEEIPQSCKVGWRFDKAGMPVLAPQDRSNVTRYLTYFNEYMNKLWVEHSSLE